MSMDAQRHFGYAKKIATLLDTKWKFLGLSFGIDPFFDFIPGISDLIPSLLSCYLLYVGYRLKVPFSVFVHMSINICIDYVLSSIPFLGFIADAFFKANVKNLKLLTPYAGLPEEGTII